MLVTTDPEVLFREHQRLVPFFLKLRLGPGYVHLPFVDDLEAACKLGLWQAAQRFDPALGCQFSTYAGHFIRGALADELRKQRRWQGQEKLPEGGLIMQPNQSSEKVEAADVEKWLSCLNERQRRLVVGYFLEAKSSSQLGEEEARYTGRPICANRVRQILEKAVRRMRLHNRQMA